MAARHRLGDLPDVGPAAIAIGVFDGVHRGHQALATAVERAAGPLGARGVMVVIDPHPDEVFGNSDGVERLTSVARTSELLTSYAEVEVVVVEFDRRVAALTPDEFLAALSPGIEVRAVVMTEESRFGRARSGTPDRVREIGEERGFELVLVPLVEMHEERVSSTLVRDAIRRGDLDRARDLMGRPHAVDGVIGARADGRRQQGVLEPAYAAALPPAGEYRVTVRAIGPSGVESEPADVSVDGSRIFLDAAVARPGDPVRITFA